MKALGYCPGCSIKHTNHQMCLVWNKKHKHDKVCKHILWVFDSGKLQDGLFYINHLQELLGLNSKKPNSPKDEQTEKVCLCQSLRRRLEGCDEQI